MANLDKVRPSTAKVILSDGKERKLKFTLNALALLEDGYGTVEKAFDELEKNSMKAIRLILWAGLTWEDPNITEMEVGNLIDITTMGDVVESLGEAFENDMPEEKKAATDLKLVAAKTASKDPNQ